MQSEFHVSPGDWHQLCNAQSLRVVCLVVPWVALDNPQILGFF
ncbi:hypothetical protein [Paraburkholderia haematera]|nr:hypothetical protein [Paraburkholderia haematera]